MEVPLTLHTVRFLFGKEKEMELKVIKELRPCYIGGKKKGLFHGWIDKSDIVPPSVMVGGHNGGVIRGTYALVELENGQIEQYYPQQIRFCDNLISQYAFEDGAE